MLLQEDIHRTELIPSKQGHFESILTISGWICVHMIWSIWVFWRHQLQTQVWLSQPHRDEGRRFFGGPGFYRPKCTGSIIFEWLISQIQIIFPAKHPSTVPAVLNWMQDNPQCRNWVTLQRWCAARTLGRVFLPLQKQYCLRWWVVDASMVLGRTLESWLLIVPFASLLKGVGFPGWLSLVFFGEESRNCHWQKKTLRSLPWSWLGAVMSFIDCTPPQVSSFYESLVKYLTFIILCIIQKNYFAKKTSRIALIFRSTSVFFVSPRAVLDELRPYLQKDGGHEHHRTNFLGLCDGKMSLWFFLPKCWSKFKLKINMPTNQQKGQVLWPFFLE